MPETAVEFGAQPTEFSEALRFLRPARGRGRKARADFVDMNARRIKLIVPGDDYSCGCTSPLMDGFCIDFCGIVVD
jgi:hypothetical protein